MAKVFLIPKQDVLVPLPLPGVGFLPAEGTTVEMEVYWQRIINDGDAVIADAPKGKTKAAAV